MNVLLCTAGLALLVIAVRARHRRRRRQRTISAWLDRRGACAIRR